MMVIMVMCDYDDRVCEERIPGAAVVSVCALFLFLVLFHGVRGNAQHWRAAVRAYGIARRA